MADVADLVRTPLFALHISLGARMTGFAGYALPLQFEGVLAEHLATRTGAGLFDISHMGQILIRGPAPLAALEALMPQNLIGLAEGRQRYGFLTNDAGGVVDDLIVAAVGAERAALVVNGAGKAAVLESLRAALPAHDVAPVSGAALLAVQGPRAAEVLSRCVEGVGAMRFMDHAELRSRYGPLFVARSGYTGEDGFEISVPAAAAEALSRDLLAAGAVPAGLGARDTLRLEAGLCLYGADLTDAISPVEAGLDWAIPALRRRGGPRAGGFPGAARILEELETGPARCRVGLLPEGRAPMRAGVPLFAEAEGGAPLGAVTSGAFGPSLGRPLAMGYVARAAAKIGCRLWGEVRGKRLPATVAALPFHPHSYHR